MAETLIPRCALANPSGLSKSRARIGRNLASASAKFSISARFENFGFRARSTLSIRPDVLSSAAAAAASASAAVDNEESMSIDVLRRFFDLNIGKWNGSFYQFDANGDMLQNIRTKLSASSYGEDDLISLIQTLYIKQPPSSTVIAGYNPEPEWVEYKIKETNLLTVDKYQQIGFFPTEKAFSLRYQTAGMLETVLRAGVLGEDDVGEESPRNLKVPSRRPSVVCENCLFSLTKDMRARAFHIMDPNGVLSMLLIFLEQRADAAPYISSCELQIGQGTYSSVFKARDIGTGKFVALKKVRFDNFEPESVRFMAREIFILRRLSHPNIIKLEGLITSRLSCSIYLVFEYMEHDLAGLSSSPDIRFSESQVKCYLHQLLSGLEHCHAHGVLHRDVKCANLLVDNEGILKIADFGLANFCKPALGQQLTSRVVTLWYRPPELLLGATEYEPTVDLWSAGCVFAELFLKKPILQGRTEVEQIHKIFKLCGSPSEEYWRKSRLPHETLFKPQQAYESCLQETFRGLPESAYQLLEKFLSIEPQKRGTAAAALQSEYFSTKPYACDPRSLPKYPPNKEIDAKNREESLKRKFGGTMYQPEAARRHSNRSLKSNVSSKLSGLEEVRLKAESTQKSGGKQNSARVNDEAGLFVDMQQQVAIHPENEYRRANPSSQLNYRFSGPMPFDASGGFTWAKKKRENQASVKSHSKFCSGDTLGVLDSSNVLQSKNSFNPNGYTKGGVAEFRLCSRGEKPYEIEKDLMVHQWLQIGHPEPYGVFEYQSYDSSEMHSNNDAIASNPCNIGYGRQEDRVEFSGPLLYQSCKVEELLEKHEQQIRQAVRRSWLQRGNR